MVILAKRQTSNASSSTVEQLKRKISLPSWVKPEKMEKFRKDGTMTVSFPRERYETWPGGLPHPQVTYDDNQFKIVLDAKNVK